MIYYVMARALQLGGRITYWGGTNGKDPYYELKNKCK